MEDISNKRIGLHVCICEDQSVKVVFGQDTWPSSPTPKPTLTLLSNI